MSRPLLKLTTIRTRLLAAASSASRDAADAAIQQAQRCIDPNRITLGFARRFAAYKRPNLLLDDAEPSAEFSATRNGPCRSSSPERPARTTTAARPWCSGWSQFRTARQRPRTRGVPGRSGPPRRAAGLDARVRASMTQLTEQFSSDRMVRDYVEQAYLPAARAFLQRSAGGPNWPANWKHGPACRTSGGTGCGSAACSYTRPSGSGIRSRGLPGRGPPGFRPRSTLCRSGRPATSRLRDARAMGDIHGASTGICTGERARQSPRRALHAADFVLPSRGLRARGGRAHDLAKLRLASLDSVTQIFSAWLFFHNAYGLTSQVAYNIAGMT